MGLAAAQPEEIRQRRSAAEQTLGLVRSRLGAAGTYDLPGTTTGPAAEPDLEATGATTLTGVKVARQKTLQGQTTDIGGGFVKSDLPVGSPELGGYIDPKYAKSVSGLGQVKKLDPEAYTKQLEQSAEFRIASRLTAQAEQLLARQGPLWDDLIKNQQMPIIEGSAAMAKETAENLRRAAAKGGAARRDAFEAIQRMGAQREINTARMQSIANMRVELDKFAIQNAKEQLLFNQAWTENLSGIRETYNKAMDSASELMATASLPVMFASLDKAQQWRMHAYAKNRAKLTRWIQGGLGVVQMVTGAYGRNAAMMGQGAQTISGALSGPESPAG